MRLYRLLLRLYPTSFRNEYGAELAVAFEAEHNGRNALVRAFAAIADVVPNAIAAHWDILRQDLTYTRRALRRAPGFAITTILVIALGVGANTAAFSVADFVLIRPLPFADPDRLVNLAERTPGYPTMELSPANYRDWKAMAKSFEAMGAYTTFAQNLTGDGEPIRIETARVSVDLLTLLGTRPLIGRVFTAADTVAGRVVILTHALWSTRFGADERVIGRSIELDGTAYTVIGVMPATFRFPDRDIALWTTLQFEASDFEDRSNNYINGIARLRPGTSLEQARAELDVIARQLELQYPKANEKTGARADRMADDISDRTRLLLLALCGAALCTLLLACANLASLFLARAVGREREIAVRAALGAGRERLVRQLVTESVLLAMIGGAVGVGVAIVAVPGLNVLVPWDLPVAGNPSVDLRVLVFATALVIVTGLGFGVMPALRVGGARGVEALRDGGNSGGGRKQRARSVLVMIEVMMSVALVTSSGLLVRAMWRLQAVNLGFVATDVVTLRTALPPPRYAAVVARQQFYEKVLDRVRRLPGVSAAAYTSFTPLTMRGGIFPVSIDGHSVIRDASNSASMRFVTPGFFDALRIPLLRGRDVLATDDTSIGTVAVVSESFAKRYWPGEEPIGKRFDFAYRRHLTVIGVVGDIRVRGPERPSEPQVYLSSKQGADGMATFYAPKDLIVRSTTPAATLVPEIRRIVREVDPRQPVSNVNTMDAIVANETASRLAQVRVLGMLALIALLLASVGIHGLLSFTVSRRSQEIGVRVALGAQSSTILRMILREGLLLAVGGLLPGIALAYAAGRGMEALLAGVKPGDPITFAAAIGVCGTMSLIGCLRPARRASRVDPAIALRAD